MADRQEESTSVPGYAFSGLTMSKLVTDRRAISSKTYPGTARLDMETSPGLFQSPSFTLNSADGQQLVRLATLIR